MENNGKLIFPWLENDIDVVKAQQSINNDPELTGK